jgi:predicted hydrocarbon binding protein
MKEYSIEEVSHIARPKLGEDIPLTLYRILRVIGMRNILGETSGATLYMMGKQVGTMIGAKDLGERSRNSRLVYLKYRLSMRIMSS